MNNQINLIEFKAGNKDEIRQSLASFCQVSMDVIKKSDVNEIYEKYSSDYEGISDALWEKFNKDSPKIIPNNFRAYHYHRTSSNGEKEWFANGLLNKSLGIKAFIHNLNKYLDINLLEFEEYLTKKNDEFHRQANQDPNYGPYAFISKKYALKNNSYNLPEAIQRADFGKTSIEIKNKITNAVKPTLVEFWFDYSTSSYLDRYINAYCGMLLGKDFSCASFEPNHTVPFENIKNIQIVPNQRKPLRKKSKKIKSNVEVRFTMIEK